MLSDLFDDRAARKSCVHSESDRCPLAGGLMSAASQTHHFVCWSPARRATFVGITRWCRSRCRPQRLRQISASESRR
jgi:hypothetical protein